jgi:hypothetical protein
MFGGCIWHQYVIVPGLSAHVKFGSHPSGPIDHVGSYATSPIRSCKGKGGKQLMPATLSTTISNINNIQHASLISIPPPVVPNDKEEGEVDKILFSTYNQFLTGKNDILVTIYDANMETDIAVDVTIITRRIVDCISFSYSSII